jgi:RHH-type rel operon transcriptional repressor/antitoxin RelB
MLSIHLEPEIEKRLELLAQKTGRTAACYAREAILEHLEEIEDTFLAKERLENPGKTYSQQEVKRELGL